MELTRRDLLKGAAALGAAATVPLTATGAALAQTTQKKELVTAQGGRHLEVRPALQHLVERHPRVLQHLRQPDEPASGRQAPSGARDRVEARGPDHVALQAAPGGQVPQRRRRSRSADAKFSIERTYDPAAKTMVATALATIERIEAPDPITLVIHTKKPDPLLPARLAFYGGQIVPKKYLESVGNDTFNAKPVGTGPVRFGSWMKDDKAVLEANPDYWGGKIEVDRWTMRPIPETAPRIAALLKGEVDVITQLPPDQGERVTGNASTRVSGALYAGLYVLAVNSKRPPLDNPAREAGAVPGHRSRGHREGAVARPRHRAERPDREGRQPLRRERCPRWPTTRREAKERLKKAGYKNEEIFIETTVGLHGAATSRWRKPSRPCGRTWASTPRSRSSSTRCAPRRTARRASRASGGRIRRPPSAIPTG